MDTKQKINQININPFWIFFISICGLIGMLAGVIALIPIIAEIQTIKGMAHAILMSPFFYYFIALIGTVISLNKLRITTNKLAKHCGELERDNVLLRKKLVELKRFRDVEMVHYADHVSAQWNTFENRFQILQDTLNLNLMERPPKTPNDIRNEKQNDAAWEQTVKAYNADFKGWTIGDDYGTGDLKTVYSGKDYNVK